MSPRPSGRTAASGSGSLTAWVVATAVVAGHVAAGGNVGTAMLLAALAAASVYLWARPALIGLAIVAAAPALAGIKRGFPVPGAKLSEVLVIVGAMVVVLLRPPSRVARWGSVDWAFLLYAATAAVMAAVHVWLDGVGSSIEPIRRASAPLQFFVLYRVAVTWCSSYAHGRLLVLRWLLFASVPVSVLALAQQVGLPGVREFVLSVVGPELHRDALGTGVIRATGPFPMWHSLGGYLLPLVLVGVALLVEPEQDVLPRRTLVAITALNVVVCVTTLTMAIGFGLLGGALLIGLWRRRLTRVATAIVAATVVVVLLFGSSLSFRYAQQYGDGGASTNPASAQTFEYRLEVWERDFMPLIRPSLGIGIGNDLPPGVVFRHTETFYLTLLLRGGLVLVTAFAVWFGVGLRAARAAAHSGAPGSDRATGTAVAATFVALLPMQLVWPYLANAGVPQALAVLLGVVVAGSAVVPAGATPRSERVPATA